MRFLLPLARSIDALNERVGRATLWLVLIVVLISAGNAISRFALGWSSNAWLEIQNYLFAAIVLLAAGWVLKHNGHVRVDVLAGRLSPRAQNWIDVFGLLVFLLPMALLIAWLSWPTFVNAWYTGEGSPNAGGLIRWPARLLLPLGFALLILQGVAELIKRLAFLTGAGPDPLAKSGPTAEELLAEDLRRASRQDHAS